MQIAVLGASGMLGSMLVDYLSQFHEITATVRDISRVRNLPNVEYRVLDVLNYRGIDLANILCGSQWVINAVGAIPQREKDQAIFYRVNAVFPNDLSSFGKPVISIATDCVFKGDKCGRHDETDEADTQDAYGQSKHLGELGVENFYSLRCSIIGLEPHGAYSLLKWLLSRPAGDSVGGYTYHLWNGITTLHFTRICRGIIEHNPRLPYLQHIVPYGYVSKYALLKFAARHFDRGDLNIQPVETELIDRRLRTLNYDVNRKLWRLAGYDKPPSIEQMVKELAEYVRVEAKC